MSALRQVVRRLAEELRSVEQAARGREEQPAFSTGVAPLDELLPGGGLRRGMLVEWLPAGNEDGGASVMALLTVRAAVAPHSAGRRHAEHAATYAPLVLIDRQGTFYPPAAAAWGIPLSSMIFLRPTNPRDEAWALDQVLRSPAVAAVLAWPSRLDGRAFRRLQLAAESSGTIGILVRPASARNDPTWADVRLRVGPPGQSGSGSGSGSRSGSRSGSGPLADSACPAVCGWRLCIERLRARTAIHSRNAVQIEITPEGQIREAAPTEHAPTEVHPYANSKSAI